MSFIGADGVVDRTNQLSVVGCRLSVVSGRSTNHEQRQLMDPAYKRILLKLSGEALMGSQSYGIDTKVAVAVAKELKAVHDLGGELARRDDRAADGDDPPLQEGQEPAGDP